MRRYLQGTLDFDCAIYAVINALACTHDIDLVGARRLFQETLLPLPAHPRLWRAFMHNETDYYWLIQHLLSRWCTRKPWHLAMQQPFSRCLLPNAYSENVENFAAAPLFTNESPRAGKAPHPTGMAAENRSSTPANVWATLLNWLTPAHKKNTPRAAIFRFHRFLPDATTPVVSHWTTAARTIGDVLFLHDASGEKNSLHSFGKSALLSPEALVYIVPESIVLVEQFRDPTFFI